MKNVKRIDQMKELEKKPRQKEEKEFIPLTEEEKVNAKEMLQKARNVLLSNNK